MQINFADMPYDVQLRLMRARLADLAENDPVYREMLGIWREKTHHKHAQFVTTQIIKNKYS
jgi:hypothetical protein